MEPRLDIVLRTSGVRAVGEKMARAPDWRRTVFFFLVGYYLLLCCVQMLEPHKEKGRGAVKKNEPIVPRPPTLNLPKRVNGAEQVVMLGVIWRITITFDGSWGINFEAILFL